MFKLFFIFSLVTLTLAEYDINEEPSFFGKWMQKFRQTMGQVQANIMETSSKAVEQAKQWSSQLMQRIRHQQKQQEENNKHLDLPDPWPTDNQTASPVEEQTTRKMKSQTPGSSRRLESVNKKLVINTKQ